MTMRRLNMLVTYVVLTALCWQFEPTNSRTSTLWQLNADSGKITTGSHAHRAGETTDSRETAQLGDAAIVLEEDATLPLPFDATANVYTHDEVFYIIASTLSEGAGSNWVRQSPENSLEALMAAASTTTTTVTTSPVAATAATKATNDSYSPTKSNGAVPTGAKKTTSPEKSTVAAGSTPGATALVVDETLDCGKPVNFTYYDYLIGVGQRFNHPLVPDPEVAYLFLKTKDENAYKNFDITALERRLKRAKREKSRSVQLYNQIGNYWRIVGDSRQAIECFRRALAMSPTNAEVLLNLARVLYNLQYLDDAIHLTRRSLEMQPPGRSAWQQYFTLGEIFRAYGHFQESILHLRHALQLYPQHEPILKALRDVENSPSSALHVYTIVIIIALVVAVFVVIITSSTTKCAGGGAGSGVGAASVMGAGSGGANGSTQSECETRTQRHFNRAMAMRSLKNSSSRNFRHRKY